MENTVIYILVTLISGAVGAWIGTYFGAQFSARKQEQRNKDMRNMAIKGLNILKKYSGKGNTYNMAEAEFNNSLSVAEKRVFLVALHKLGIPILVVSPTRFDIQVIRFEKTTIDCDEISAIINQVEQGYCDQLFYIDPETYFTENIRLNTLRSISKRWVEDVFAYSTLDRKTELITYPENWSEQFTWAESLNIAVFKTRIAITGYYSDKGKVKPGAVKEICSDIDRGLWDNCLFWDIETYNNVTATNSLNTTLTTILNQQNIFPNFNAVTK